MMKDRKRKYDYGACHVCGAAMREQPVKQDFWIRDNLIVVESVPAGVCTQCGERVVNADVGQRIASLIQDAPRLRHAKILSVPVIRFAKKVA